VAPSAVPFADDWVTPREVDEAEIERIVGAWGAAARRAHDAGFDLVEIHDAHGYLMHEFLSPVSNKRTDAYGGSLENRSRLLFRVVDAVRSVWPEEKPLFLRVSATDWVPGGLTPPDFVALAPRLCDRRVDLLDCSSGGIVTGAPPVEAMTPGFQVPFAEEIRRDGGIATMAVGLITEPAQADAIIASERADLVAIGREMLRDPQWPLRAARALGQAAAWPKSYERAK
jgi:2,4-dienoyl-CoA reductase-like NADH-dependent reductase (Old Yellow Enzyme family)